MKLLEIWIQTPMADAIGLTLLHSLWQGALIAAALSIVLSAIRSSRIRYQAACCGLFLLLSGSFFTFLRLLFDSTTIFQSANQAVFPVWGRAVQWSSAAPSQSGLAAAIPWLTPIWLTGVFVFCVCHVAGWIEVGRLQRRGVCTAPECWQSSVVRLAAALNLSRPILLLESCLAQTPMVLGHFRPVILLPVGFLTGLPVDQVEAILLHELAHIRRCDYLVNNLQRLAESLFFYHPAAWWISRIIRTERENCCDDMVVAFNGDVRAYAVALASLEENRSLNYQIVLAASGGNLMKRIRRLLYPQRPNGAWGPVIAVAILMLTATAGLAAWQSQQSSTGTWLNEDVAYIITAPERAAFLNLTTDDERQKFIEQFWLRRDPAGAPPNTFKAEHYHRLAFANKHFKTTSGQPGWQTDRGHIWIVYGPPDEIDSHPRRFEDWLYNHLEGIGNHVDFHYIDPTGSGDFKLAPGSPTK